MIEVYYIFSQKGRHTLMKKRLKQIIAILTLIAIAIFIAVFIVSAFTADSGEAGNRFMALLFCVVAIPLLAWILLFCIEHIPNTHAVTETFPDQEESTDE